jgi:hypothetical protein
MSTVLRIWKESKDSLPSNWIIWDRGDEMWELRGDVLRHFEVLERSSSNNVITELLRPLRESAIPLEAIRQSVQGWQVDEGVPTAQPSPQVKPVLPLTSSPLSTPNPSPRKNGPLKAREQGEKKQANATGVGATGVGASGAKATGDKVSGTKVAEKSNLQSVLLPLEEKSRHEKPSQATQEMQEEESSQHVYNHPTELWSSLSQWIPQHALFQPSLHHQATLELSDTPAQTYPYQIDSSGNSRPAQGQRQHVRQAQHSKPYRPKPSLREIEIPKRPLFV